jgi:hypothetical protein
MPTDPTDLWFDPTIDLDKLSPAERRQLTRLMRRLGMSLWETLATMRERLLFLTDPAPGTGERFTAKDFARRDDFVTAAYFDNAEIPAPDANCDIITAMFWAERDRENFAALLNEEPNLPLKTLISGIVNQLLWCRFLARRDPDPAGRKRAAVMATEWEGTLNRSLDRIFGTGPKRKLTVGDFPEAEREPEPDAPQPTPPATASACTMSLRPRSRSFRRGRTTNMTAKYQWSLLGPWHSGAGPNQHLEAGSVIDGQADRYDELVSASCRGQPVPLPLPMEASPLTQDAADMSAKWHPDHLHLLKPGPGVVIRPYDTTHPLRAYERAEMAKAANACRNEIWREREYAAHVQAEAEAERNSISRRGL